MILTDTSTCSAEATYAQSGCPLTCTSFVQSNPSAFTDAYWSINSLRVYTTSGKPATGTSLAKGAIGGIAVGAALLFFILGLIFWRYRSRRNIKSRARALDRNDTRGPMGQSTIEEDGVKRYTGWAGSDRISSKSGSGEDLLVPALATVPATSNSKGKAPKPRALASAHPRSQEAEEAAAADKARRSQKPVKKIESVLYLSNKPRTGPTTLRMGMTARHHLDGETPAGAYHDEAEGIDLPTTKYAPNAWVG
jgi:hypothetical protein